MSAKTMKRINWLRAKMSNLGAKELTPEEGILLKADMRGQYFIEERRYIGACLERRFFMWDLLPNR